MIPVNDLVNIIRVFGMYLDFTRNCNVQSHDQTTT